MGLFKLVAGWTGAGESGNDSRLTALKPSQLVLLTSDGSLTDMLEVLCNSKVEAEIKSSRSGTLGVAQSEFLGMEPGTAAIERNVWLKAGGRKLVYAHSIVPSSLLAKDLADDISGTEIPMGRILKGYYPFSMKDRIEIGIVLSDDIAGNLAIPPDTPLWARRYRLSVLSPERNGSVRAMITEVFSLDLLGMPVFG